MASTASIGHGPAPNGTTFLVRMILAATFLSGCAQPPGSDDVATRPDDGAVEPGVEVDDGGGGEAEDEAGAEFEAGEADDGETTLDPDAACTSAGVEAVVERLPVDIIWVVDNSASMRPAIEQVQSGLNDFAALVGGAGLDYHVLMLSLRGVGETTTSGGTRFQACIPPPLGGPSCADNPPLFHQVEVDIRSTQPLEQFLGTLGQTAGYTALDERGSDPWLDLLRPEATKTIVVVTDDNARMVERSGTSFVAGPGGGATGDPAATADWFETTTDVSDGSNPFNSLTLPEGILDPRWGGLFDGYTFSALYGWGSETDPSVPCTYSGGTEPPSSGPTYTELVTRRSGVRARICDGPAAWGPFFDGVATAVERASRVDCTIPIPEPPAGMTFERDMINVLVDDGSGSVAVYKVPSAADCDDRGGWYYDDESAPTAVVLCPATCERVQPTGGATTRVDVQFGCATILL
ncbi:MAG: hypothetical protein HY907_05910 [Deltaproteobacteria bacterium]|nr:hypothetical protein [Deltaproteobacteria bacterium]